jgi:hypothetical protein
MLFTVHVCVCVCVCVCVLTAYLVPWVALIVHILPKNLFVRMWSTVLYGNQWPFVVAHGIHLDPVP